MTDWKTPTKEEILNDLNDYGKNCCESIGLIPKKDQIYICGPKEAEFLRKLGYNVKDYEDLLKEEDESN